MFSRNVKNNWALLTFVTRVLPATLTDYLCLIDGKLGIVT